MSRRMELAVILIGCVVFLALIVALPGCSDPFDCGPQPHTRGECEKLCEDHGAEMEWFFFRPSAWTECGKFSCECETP